MLRPWLFILWVAGLQAVAALAMPGNSAIVVECSDSSTIDVEPPRLITLAFRVSNRADIEQTVWDEIQLPEGWQPLVQSPRFSLQPQSYDLRLWCISVPAAAPSGRYALTYSVHSASDSVRLGYAEAGVNVAGVIRLEATTDPVPERIVAGEEYCAHLRITNRGNAPCVIVLEPSLSASCQIELNRTQLTIEPNTSDTVTVQVQAGRDLSVISKHRLAVNVFVPQQLDAGIQVLAPKPVEIVPRAAPAGDMYHRVPSRLATRFIGEGDQSVMQMEYAGQGTVDPSGRYTIDYLVRGPRDLERNSFGTRDEYYLRVRDNNGEVRVGDQLFTLSPLTERNRLGRGVNAVYRYSHIQTGGYVLKSRAKYPDLEERAGFAGLYFGRTSLRINVLRKQTAADEAMMVGALSEFSPLPRSRMSIEYSSGEASGGSGWCNAAAGRFDGNWKRIRLTLDKTYAAPNFPGYLRDHDQNSVAVYLPLFKRLNWQGSYRTLDLNLNRNPEFHSALREQQWQTRFNATLPFSLSGEVEGEDLLRRDVLEPSQYGYREQSVTLGLRRSFHFLAFDGSVRSGQWTNLRSGGADALERYSLGLRFSPSPWQSYGTSFQTGRYGSSSGIRRNQIVRLSVQYKIMRRLSVGVNVQRSTTRSEFAFDNNQFDVDAKWVLSWSHILTLRYRRLEYEQDYLTGGSSLLVGYEVPVGMPISRQTSIGRLKGRIYDEEDPQRRGLSGVLVSLNNFSARTDANGNFSFPSLVPGQYYMQIDRSSIGFEKIPVSRTPLPVNVHGGKTEQVQIAITRCATLRGEVAVFGLTEQESDRGIITESAADSSDQQPAEMERLNGLAGVDMELRSLREAIHITTDRYGRFSFDELRPGEWTLTISSAAFPAFHQLEADSMTIVLAPGEVQEQQIRVVPRVRPVIVVDEGPVPVVRRDRRR